MADDAMRFLIRSGAGLDALDAGTALTAALPAAMITETGGSTARSLLDALAAKGSIGHTSILDADYAATSVDVQIGFASLTAPRTVTLPDVDTFPLGQVLFIANESGQCSTTNAITIAIGGETGDTIAGQTAIQITDVYQGVSLRRGAANVWIIAQ